MKSLAICILQSTKYKQKPQGSDEFYLQNSNVSHIALQTFVVNSNRNYGASLDKTPYDQVFTSFFISQI